MSDKTINTVIDLAFLEDDQWALVDYKTDKDPGRGIKEKQLYFLRLGRLEQI